MNESIRKVLFAEFESMDLKSNGHPLTKSDSPVLSEIYSLLDDNIWYKYLKKLYITKKMKGENWIDFESEIRFIIQKVDENTLSLTEYLNIEKIAFPQKFIEVFDFTKYFRKKNKLSSSKITVKDFREKTFEDLERLTRALELYLAVFVKKITVTEKIPEISGLNPDYVVNFNYTDTYQRLYDKRSVYYVHGKADADRPAEENNMVLGIDEYWPENERDERTNFTVFKKFSQRIQKHTGNDCHKYLKEMQKLFKEGGNNWTGNADTTETHPDGVSYVYVFGHSLDVTDRDILSMFIGDDSTSVTVYCRDKGTEGELIANTIKLIGEERLLEKANHVPVKLKYVIQGK